MPTNDPAKQLPPLATALNQLIIHILQLKEHGESTHLEGKLHELLDKLNEYRIKHRSMLIVTLINNVKCTIEFARNFSKLPLSAKQTEWFNQQFEILTTKLMDTVPFIINFENSSFNEIVSELISIGNQFHLLELSLIVANYTKTAIQDLTSSPANLANFYSTLGLFKVYQTLLPKEGQEIFEYIGSILCYLRLTPNIPQNIVNDLTGTVNQIANSAHLVFNPITSEEVKKDTLLGLQELYAKVKQVLPLINFSNLYTQAESIEIRRFIDLLQKPASANPFEPLFKGFSSSLMTVHAIRKNYDKNSLNYLLFRSLLNAMNIARDYWHKGQKEDQKRIVLDLQSMGQHLLEYLQLSMNEPIVEGRIPESLKKSAHQFNKYYHDLIAFAHEHVPAKVS